MREREGPADGAPLPAPRAAGPATDGPPGSEPVLPDYRGACLSNLVPGLMRPPGERPSWLPGPLARARQVVLLVIDGLGWLQLRDRRPWAPVLTGFEGGPITSVVPTTTATALSSITFGSPPATHGMVGYRVRVPGAEGDEVLNALRWTTSSGDARGRVDPATFLSGAPFAGVPVPVVSRATYAGSGFSEAHLRGSRPASWHFPSSIAVEVGRRLREGVPFVYAYYEGVDTVAHATGLGDHYDAELRAVDRIVGDLAAVLPAGASLAVTADHGQVDVGERADFLDEDVLAGVTLLSGEARFRWLHTRPGAAADVLGAVSERYGHEAWVRSVDQLDEAGWFGAPLDARAGGRLGQIAVVARAPVGYLDPADRRRPPERTDRSLVCRHGSLTAEEMWVPLLATSA